LFEPVDDDDDKTSTVSAIVTFTNPIASCDPKAKTKKHTDYNMIKGKGWLAYPASYNQPASGKVLFTYDVTWVENLELKWASRWDVYLSMDNSIPAKVHWFSIADSLVIVFVLSAMIATFLVRDFARYNTFATDEEKVEDLKEFGWKLVHADVFRPPAFSPLLLSVACGTGAQVLCMSFLTIIFSAMGFLSPANRGALLMAELLLFVMMGGVAGYVTARMYKTFKGKSWQQATICTALGFPGIAFTFFFILDLMALALGSTYAVPWSTMVILLVLWFGISTPLVFFGAYFGYKEEAIEFPVNTSSIPRQIPDQPWFMSIPFTLAIGGILPFGVCFVELYFILDSVWMDKYYYVFGFLLLVYFILVVTCAEITVLSCYFQLCRENYHWWWRSFCTAGSTALYVFFYSFVYFKQLEANTFAAYVLYFGYMGLVCFGLFLMTGFIGVASALWFNKTIYSSIKIT
jgi:transmembrane 9 superfamily protein 2/4